MSIEIVLAAPLTAEAKAPAAVAHTWKALPPKPVLGLIDNSKTGAAELLDALGRNLVRRGVAVSYFMIQKETAAFSITNEDRTAMLARAHVIVSGIGD